MVWNIHVCVKSLHTCLTLCNPMDYNLPGFSVHGILQARILEWAAMPSSRGSSRPRDRTHVFYVSCIGRRVLYDQHHRLYYVLSHVLLFCNAGNSSPPGSSVHGIFQARMLKWIAYTYTYVYIYKRTHVYGCIWGTREWCLSWYRTRLQCGRSGFHPWVGKDPGEGQGYTFHYSGLENSMDRVAHGVSKSQTWLSDFRFHIYT